MWVKFRDGWDNELSLVEFNSFRVCKESPFKKNIFKIYAWKGYDNTVRGYELAKFETQAEAEKALDVIYERMTWKEQVFDMVVYLEKEA